MATAITHMQGALMAALDRFTYKGVRVSLWSKSFGIQGMPDTIFLGTAPKVEQIKRLIDTIQAATPQPKRGWLWRLWNGYPGDYIDARDVTF